MSLHEWENFCCLGPTCNPPLFLILAEMSFTDSDQRDIFFIFYRVMRPEKLFKMRFSSSLENALHPLVHTILTHPFLRTQYLQSQHSLFIIFELTVFTSVVNRKHKYATLIIQLTSAIVLLKTASFLLFSAVFI